MKEILAILLALPSILFAQKNLTISGKVIDKETGEELIGVSVVAAELTSGTITNAYGFYSLTLPEGLYTISYSCLGYDSQTLSLELMSKQTINIELNPVSISLNEVVISSVQRDKNITSAKMGTEKINMKDIESIPVLFGEKDLLKTIQLLPGISSSSEGSSGFNVRGGSMDQNLVLLDEATVYSPSHLMGFFSVFNSDALKDATIFKGGIPARYGGRASSVLDIVMNNGNSKKFCGAVGLGLISSKLTLEAPLVKNKMSVSVSGRRAYADWIAKKIVSDDIINNDMSLYFYDLNAKYSYTVNSKNRLFISGYWGNDFFVYSNNIGSSWGNKTGTFRWNHIFSNKLFSNTSFVFSTYKYGFNLGRDDLVFNSGIEDISVKEDACLYLKPSITLKFGFKITHNSFHPGIISGYGLEAADFILEKKRGVESSVYLLNEHKFSNKISAEYGIRLSNFSHFGPGWQFTYDNKNVPVDSNHYKKIEIAQTFSSLEPRLSVNYLINNNSSVKFSYNRMAQYLNLLSNNTSGIPTDIWMPASNNIKPLYVEQVSLGFFKNFYNNDIETSVEVYYKRIRNKADYEDGAEILFNKHVESQILTGRGRSYGIEFYMKKKYGKFTGWTSYTLSRTENKIGGINDFNWYPVKHDKTHDFSIVAAYKVLSRVTCSAVWTYSTGNAVTFPTGKYKVNGRLIPYYTERNAYRMPDYHRLDISLSFKGRKREKFETVWDFSIYNVYNKHNAYSINFKENVAKGTTEAIKLSLFGIVPSISCNLKY